MSLKNVACFGLFATSVRACDVVCPLDTAAVTEFNDGLICFLALLPRSFCAGTLSPKGKCCYFLREV